MTSTPTDQRPAEGGENPPEWALDKAVALIRAEGQPQTEDYIRGTFAAIALAKVIAQHEEPPADPLLIEAEQVCREWRSLSPVELALAAIKRGIELGAAK